LPKAIIIGAGIAGLATGIAFKRAGWAVEVIERAARIEPLGAALSLWTNACSALTSLKVLEPVVEVSAPIHSMLLADRQGRPIINRNIPGPALLVTRAALQGVLMDALGTGIVKLGYAVHGIDKSGRVTLDDGSLICGDLIVDAGGVRSPTARALTPTYAGYGGVLALTGPVVRDGLNGLAAEYWGYRERFGVFELPQDRRYWFYMRNQPSDAPMPSLSECLDRASDWPNVIAETISATTEDRLIPFAVHANPPPRSLIDRRVVRVGDAAHAMEPNLGQGACQGLEDAAALLAIARTSAPENIASNYERLRLKRSRMIVQESSRARLGSHGPAMLRKILKTALRTIPQPISERAMSRVQTMPDYASILGNG
jgi:2-polyprenyl-6-methoxyphenol hydroxylase-like FAD-dependent oxidoreductase